jgi:hypothetical protein
MVHLPKKIWPASGFFAPGAELRVLRYPARRARWRELRYLFLFDV